LAGATVSNVQGALGSSSTAHTPLPADAAEIGAFVAALLAQTLQPAAAETTPAAAGAAAASDRNTVATAGAVLPDPRQALAARQLLTASPARRAAEPMLQAQPAGESARDGMPIAAHALEAAGPQLAEDGL